MLDTMGKALSDLSEKDVVFADIRQEVRSSTQILVINGNLRRFNRATKAGTVARALIGECWGMASTSETLTDEICKSLLTDAVKSAKANAKFSRKNLEFSEIKPIEKSVWQKTKVDPADVSNEEKLEFVIALDKGQKIDDRIVNTNSTYNDSKLVFRLANTIGSRLEWDELRTIAAVQPIARQGDRMQFDYDVRGGVVGYELIRQLDPNSLGAECSKGALELLNAEKPPSGKMTVIVDGDISGVIAHEVCGHASEADEVVKGRSFLTGQVGNQLGTEQVTMVDDGTLDSVNGNIPFDSEGTPASRTTIIEDGFFEGYLHTLETAIMMDVTPTGNGRAQDYNRRIFARMTNTFFDKGDWKDDEIVAETKDGLYVVKGTSGMEDVVGGGVQCSALKGYIIKNGEATQLVRSMSLAGQVLDILKTVDAVGNSLEFRGGTCGKGEEDFLPVATGGPHMRVKMVVGGG